MPTRVAPSSSPMSSSPASSGSPSEDEAPGPAQGHLAIRDKGKGRDVSIGKRKRAGTAQVEQSSRCRTNGRSGDRDEEYDSDVYDPDQPMDERREIQRRLRELQKGINENLEEYMTPGSTGLKDTLMMAQEVARGVKQTTEATIDSRLLVSAVDLSYRKTVRLMQGGTTEGVDIDEFVSKCCTYMRQAGGIEDDEAPELSSTQARRRRTGNDGRLDDEGNDEAFNWSHLGKFASLPNVRRPALPGFLLGPLSVEKKVRKISKRTAPFRPNNLAETRPEVLNVEDLAKKENDLTAICSKILKQLQDIQSDAQTKLVELFDEREMSEEEQIKVMHEHGLRETGGVDLLRFVVNPKSFGQTVENMFYVSFLIRDGKVGIEFDSNDLPSLSPIGGDEVEEEGGVKREKAKQQAIFSMDMQTWQDIIDTFDIKEPMIKHRKEATAQGPGARGWYS
ncbi:nuclear protein qri2 [Colletotrichum truncatum]|uniref:Nuclear protein qri2 n=1 Tax=Colletotrichum truncatum TaxID=5467 RepID=A0ACC3Z0Z8_COLTU|nr:nuclear protein qri2 [Colletotrichum truncatum]KAF6800473.1 nuclear protein qri2 [Colletotrichum truncatum]